MRKIEEITNNSGKRVSFENFADEYYTYVVPKSRVNYFTRAHSALTNLLLTLTDPTEISLIISITNRLEEIIKASPSRIPQIIADLTTGSFADLLYNSVTNSQTDLGEKVEKAFNYDAFRKSSKASWFCIRLGLKTCLYCNAQFALVTGNDAQKKRLLFQLDHFYNQSRFPFLSLTMGNLIPSCSTCNITKSKEEFSIDSHVHPYHEDANSLFQFSVDPAIVLEYLLNGKNTEQLIPKLIVTSSKFAKHVKSFHLEEIYAKHTDIVEDLFMKSVYYTPSKKRELENDFKKDLNLSGSIIDRFILGNYTLDSEINNRPLAKLMKDIGKAIGLI